MPLDITRNQRKSEVVITARGMVTGPELLETLKALYASELVSYDQLWDFTEAEHVDAATDEIRRVAELDRDAASRHRHIRIAIAASQDLTYGLSRMWEAFVDDTPVDTCVARTLEEARKWLDSAPE